MLLETTSKYRADTETQARDMIEAYRAEAEKDGHLIKKAGYEYKCKKAKGEIVAEAWVVTITEVFATVWEELA